MLRFTLFRTWEYCRITGTYLLKLLDELPKISRALPQKFNNFITVQIGRRGVHGLGEPSCDFRQEIIIMVCTLVGYRG